MLSLRSRHVAASVLMAGSSLMCVYRVTLAHSGMWVTEATANALLLGIAAAAFARKSLFAQTVARGLTWAWLFNLAWGYATIGEGKMDRWPAPAMLVAAAALALAHPLMHTPAARESFAPLRFRRLFLAGATATVGVAGMAFYYAAFGILWQRPLMSAINAGLGLTLLLATRGLLGMRTWGALLGGLVSVMCLATAPFWGSTSVAMTTSVVSLAALPMLLFWILPLVVARLSPRPEARLRIAEDAPRQRLQVDETAEEEAAEEDELSVEDAARGRHLQRALE